MEDFQIFVSVPLIVYHQNLEIVKSKLKSEKSNKKHKCNIVLKENKKKKEIKIDMMSVTWPLDIYLLILCKHTYL